MAGAVVVVVVDEEGAVVEAGGVTTVVVEVGGVVVVVVDLVSVSEQAPSARRAEAARAREIFFMSTSIRFE